MHAPRPALAGAVVVAALVAAGLTGCSGSGVDGCSPEVSSGPGSDAIAASGAFATAPTVSVGTPLHVSTTQASTLIAGHGTPIERGQEVVTDLTFIDGTTGRTIAKSKYTDLAGAASFVVGSSVIPGLQRSMVCAQVGERLAMAIPPSAIDAGTRTQLGLGSANSLVLVADVRRAYLARANGTPQVMAGGLPSVVLAPNGQPGLTLPLQAAPKTLEIANLRDGSGPVLRTGDTAVLNYSGYIWNSDGTTSVFDSTWEKGMPLAVAVKESGNLKGLYRAIVGQRVGSQVLAVLPPSYAYGSAGSDADAVPPNATLVFVIDVLGRN